METGNSSEEHTQQQPSDRPAYPGSLGVWQFNPALYALYSRMLDATVSSWIKNSAQPSVSGVNTHNPVEREELKSPETTTTTTVSDASTVSACQATNQREWTPLDPSARGYTRRPEAPKSEAQLT